MGRYVAVGGTIYLDFSTQTLAGAKATLNGTPVISAYKDDSLVQTTAGITLTVDHDGITGCNVVKVDTSADGTFYSSGAQIRLRITTGTVDSINVAGDPVGEFTMGVANANVASMANGSLTANAIAASALNGKGDWNTTTPPTAVAIRQEIDANSTKLDLAVSTRLASADYTAPNNAGISVAAAAAASAASSAASAASDTTSILAKIGAFGGTGINTILGFLKAIMRSDASVPGEVGGTFASSTDSLEALGTAVAGLGSNLGSGADLCTQRIRESDLTPVADADVWITTDSAGTNVIAGTRQTDSSGEVTFLLDAGNSYYLWAQKDGWEGIQGTAFTAVAD